MSRTRIFMIAGALFVAILIGLLFQGGGSDNSEQLAPALPVQTEETGNRAEEQDDQLWVMVATTDFPTGHNVAEGDLGWQAWQEQLDENTEYVTLGNDPGALGKYLGYVIQRPVSQGEPVTLNNMVDPGASGFMAALLSPGMRAASVAISQERAAGGFIVPNDRVDVILLQKIRAAGGRSGDVTLPRVVIENVRVLSVDGKVNQSTFGRQRRESAAGNRATLEVTPQDAQIIAVASSIGVVHLVLRGVSDTSGYSGATPAGLSLLPGGSAVPLYSAGRTTELPVGGR